MLKSWTERFILPGPDRTLSFLPSGPKRVDSNRGTGLLPLAGIRRQVAWLWVSTALGCQAKGALWTSIFSGKAYFLLFQRLTEGGASLGCRRFERQEGALEHPI